MTQRMMILLLVILVFFSTKSETSQSSAHSSGQSFASSLLGNVASAAQSTSPQVVPGFKTDRPKEAGLVKESLSQAALQESNQNEASQHIISQAKERQSFKIDPNTDPLFTMAHEATHNPLKTLEEEIKETSEGNQGADELKVCDEGGEEYAQNCSKHLEIVLKITPAHTVNVSYCPGHKERRGWSFHYSHWTCGGCATRQQTIPKNVEVISERWIDGCKLLEKHVEQGLCRYVSASTSPKNETRQIQGEPITRDHFEEHYEYACFKTSDKSCAGLRERGCYQIKSSCKERMNNRCVLWEQTYKCPSVARSGKAYSSSNKNNPFCLTGNCADTSYEANGELMDVMSQLSVLREAQNDLRNYKVIFRGNDRRCTRNCLNFRDCCGSGKGWGVSLHLTDCDKDEQELRKLRDKNLCIQVGTYCAEREPIFKTCLRKKTTFCCYGTKLARLIQQNGRAQLGIGFGSPEKPDCSGFSAEQLGKLDFSKIDFSELYEEIKQQMVPKDQAQTLTQVSADRIRKNMTLLTKPSLKIEDQQSVQQLREKGF